MSAKKIRGEMFYFYCDKTAYIGGKCPMKGEKKNVCLQSNHHRCPNLMVIHEDLSTTTNGALVVKNNPKKRTELHYNAKAFCSDKCHIRAERNYNQGLRYNGLRWVWDTIVIEKGRCLECRKKPHRMMRGRGVKK